MTTKNYLITIAVLVLLLAGFGPLAGAPRTSEQPPAASAPREIALPIAWSDLGEKLVALGVIDESKFNALYAARPDLAPEIKKLMASAGEGNLVVTPDNAGLVLNLLWAFGLANDNPILNDQAQMMNPAYGGAGGFASTGGWTLARSTSSGQAGDAMRHYSAHTLVALTGEEQAIVNRMAENIYRPCCDNPTHFPDCNHGMAMLGLLELMAKAGVSEHAMYRYALAVQELWFPGEYATIARYLEAHGESIASADPKEILGPAYSSASGYARIQASLPKESTGGIQCSA